MRELGHLPVTNYLEEQLEAAEQHLIRRLTPPFSAILKLRRLAEAAVRDERPFVAWSCGDWRLVYFEEDRELMDTIFAEESTQAKLRFFRERGPLTQRPARAPAVRDGACGSSANVTREALAQLFGGVAH